MFTKTFPRPCTCTKTSWMWLTIVTIFSSPSSSTNTFIGLIKMEKNIAQLFLTLRRKRYNSIILLEYKIHDLDYTPHYIWGNHNLVQAILHHIYRSEVDYFDMSHVYNWAMFHKYHIILQTILIHTCNNNNR